MGTSPKQGFTFDRNGRMNYHPDVHHNQGKPWTAADQKYLIEHYEKIGPDQISLELGRTIHTVMTRAYGLRKKGLMPKRKTHKSFRRNEGFK